MVFNPDALTLALAEYEAAEPQPGYAVALSGGADSLALLIGLSRAVPPERICALHFNHRMHPDAAAWASYCQLICKRYGIVFTAEEWRSQDGSSLQSESEAREARYQWFASALPRGYILLTGHHLDDQAETVLMNLAEGRNLQRVAGIRKSRSIQYGESRQVVRPLLGFTHDELCQFLTDNNIEWIEDSANTDRAHSRNMIREDVLTLLNARWPQATRSLGKFAGALSDSLELIEAYAHSLVDQLSQPQKRTLFCRVAPLSLQQQSILPQAAFNIVIRLWCHQAGALSPRDRQLVEFRQQLVAASSEHHCCLTVGDNEIIFYDGHLHLLRRRHIEGDLLLPCVSTPHRLGTFLSVWFERADTGLDPEIFDADELYWCERKPSHRFSISTQAGTTTLKKAMQSARLAPWLRQGLPVLAIGESVVWAHGLGVSAQFVQQSAGGGCLVPRFAIDDNQAMNSLQDTESG